MDFSDGLKPMTEAELSALERTITPRSCRGSSAPCRCPACSRYGEASATDCRHATTITRGGLSACMDCDAVMDATEVAEAEPQPVSDAYRFDLPPSPYRVWHGIISPTPSEAAVTASDSDAVKKQVSDMYEANARMERELAGRSSQCDHRERYNRKNLSFCQDCDKVWDLNEEGVDMTDIENDCDHSRREWTEIGEWVKCARCGEIVTPDYLTDSDGRRHHRRDPQTGMFILMPVNKAGELDFRQRSCSHAGDHERRGEFDPYYVCLDCGKSFTEGEEVKVRIKKFIMDECDKEDFSSEVDGATETPTVAPVAGKGDAFRRIAAEIGELVASKNEAYGSSFAKTGDFLRLLYPGGIAEDQYDDALLMVRIFDKQMRIANRKGAFGEDPYRDIMGYGLCGVVMGIDNEW